MSIRLAIPKDKAHIISMVNEVYYTSEREFWSEGYYRISERDFEDYIRNKWLYVLEQKEIILGCVLFKQVEKDISSFSMLVCNPSHRKKGVGKTLVSFVNQEAIVRNNKKMYLELLSPKDWIHEEKKFLKDWYIKMGYKLKKEVDFKDYHPEHAPFMKCDLIFSLYEKNLI